MEQLAAVQLAEHFQDAGDLAAHRRFAPPAAVALQERAQVAVRRVLECQAIQGRLAGRDEREGVEHADRPRVIVEQLSEVRPPVARFRSGG